MIRLSRLLVLLGLLFAASPALAQKGTPTLQMDSSGLARCLFLWDITKSGSDKGLKLGCVDTSTHSWNPAAIGSLSSPPTGSAAVFTLQNSSVAATDIYNPQVPAGWFTVDGYRSTVFVPSGATAQNTEAYGFYVRNQAVSSGLGGNAVGMFGVATCEVNGCSSWGLNPALNDSPNNSAITTVNRKLIGAEFDISAHGTGTSVQGISLMGSSIAQPAGADGFTCGSLSTTVGVAKWVNCLVIGDNVATTGAIFGGAGAAGANVASIPIKFGIYDSGSTGHYVQIKGIPFGTDSAVQFSDNIRANGLVFTNPAAGSSPSIFPAGTDTNINLTLAGKGTGAIVVNTQLTANGHIVAPSLSTTGTATGSLCIDSSGNIFVKTTTGACL